MQPGHQHIGRQNNQQLRETRSLRFSVNHVRPQGLGCWLPVQGARGNQNVDWKTRSPKSPATIDDGRLRDEASHRDTHTSAPGWQGSRSRKRLPELSRHPANHGRHFGMPTGIVPVLGEDTQFSVCDPVAIGPRTPFAVDSPPPPPPASRSGPVSHSSCPRHPRWMNRSCMHRLEMRPSGTDRAVPLIVHRDTSDATVSFLLGTPRRRGRMRTAIGVLECAWCCPSPHNPTW